MGGNAPKGIDDQSVHFSDWVHLLRKGWAAGAIPDIIRTTGWQCSEKLKPASRFSSFFIYNGVLFGWLYSEIIIAFLGAFAPKSPNQSINRGILSQWSDLIDEWVKDPSIPLIVRKDAQKGQVITHPSGREIIVTDNTFAVWVFKQVLKGYIPSLKDMSNKLGNKKAPRGNMTGWKLCHIKPVGLNTKEDISNLKISVIKDHFRKYANPNNMFVLPKEIGGLGEIDEFINEQ